MSKYIYKLKGGRVVYNANSRPGSKWRGLNLTGHGDQGFLNLLNVNCNPQKLGRVPQEFSRSARQGELSVKGTGYTDSYKNINAPGPYDKSLADYVNDYLKTKRETGAYDEIDNLRKSLINAYVIRSMSYEEWKLRKNRNTQHAEMAPENMIFKYDSDGHKFIINGISNLINLIRTKHYIPRKQQETLESGDYNDLFPSLGSMRTRQTPQIPNESDILNMVKNDEYMIIDSIQQEIAGDRAHSRKFLRQSSRGTSRWSPYPRSKSRGKVKGKSKGNSRGKGKGKGKSKDNSRGKGKGKGKGNSRGKDKGRSSVNPRGNTRSKGSVTLSAQKKDIGSRPPSKLKATASVFTPSFKGGGNRTIKKRVKTSKQRKSRSSRLRSYRRRVKTSHCRGRNTALCNRVGAFYADGKYYTGCKMAKGKQRSFCRKRNNKNRTKKSR